MNCPRCGSERTEQKPRKAKPGEPITVDERCVACGWHGQHTRPASTSQPTPKTQRELF